jgi:predicted Zn-dependent protease
MRRGVSLALAALAALSLAGEGQAAPSAQANELIAKAREDLGRSDGIAAEIRLKNALAKGASRTDVAALMGAAYLAQEDRVQARQWLAAGQFFSGDAVFGFRMLAQLERDEGHLPAAGAAFDRALAIAPKDPVLWVEIGRLRYAGGEHTKAVEAADYALKLAPRNPRTLEFRGQMLRDQIGLTASLPWFEAGLQQAPDDISLLGEYAATLGELGRAKDMLAVTRHMLRLDGHNARAFYLQAVLAARAGDTRLARSLLNRTGDKLDDMPGAKLLEGALELRAGNYNLAMDALEELVRRQPANAHARLLLARAYDAGGESLVLVKRFADEAARPEASPYLLTLVGRAYENLGERDQAAAFLDHAAKVANAPIAPVAQGSDLGALIAGGQLAEAQKAAESYLAASPGSADAQVQAGDVQLAMGHGSEALAFYRKAAAIRLPEALFLKSVGAMLEGGDSGGAAYLVEAYLYQNPSSQPAVRLAATLAARTGDWKRCRLLLENALANDGGDDARLLAELSLAQLRTGDAKAAEGSAHRAYLLQRASPLTTQAWGMSLAAQGKDKPAATALLAKAKEIGGDNPLLAEGRRLLAKH